MTILDTETAAASVGQAVAAPARAVATRGWLRLPPLYVQVLIGMAAGIALGHFYPEVGARMKPASDIFVHMLKMLIAPVIFCCVVTGIGSAADLRSAGRIGGKALIWFELATTAALAIGLVAAHVFQPGAGLNIDPAQLDGSLISRYANASHRGFIDHVLAIIPHSFVGALADGEPLPTLFIALLTGVACLHLGDTGQKVFGAAEMGSKLFFRLVGMAVRLAPLGAFGGMAFTVGKYGVHSLGNLAALIGVFYLTAVFFAVGVLGIVCRLCGVNILKLFAYFREEFLVVLGASSTEPVMPRLMQKMESLGVSRQVTSLVTPTGYSFNMDGTCVYITLAVTFLAQAINSPMSEWQQVTLIVVAMLTSKGATGVSGSGFVALAATLTAMPDIPIAALAILVGIDRFMSECRALTSFAGNIVANVVVARWEGALDMERMRSELSGRPADAA